MLVSTRFGQSSQVHRVKMPGGARYQLTFFPDSVSGGSYEPSKGEYFVFGKGSGGNERFQLYRYDFATGDVTLLTDGKSRNARGVWANAGGTDGLHLHPPQQPRHRHLGHEPGRPEERQAARSRLKGAWFPIDWSPDDERLLVGQVDLGQRELPLGGRREVGQEDANSRRRGRRRSPTAAASSRRTARASTSRPTRTRSSSGSTQIDLETGEHTFLTDHIKWDVEEFELSHDGKTIAFVVNEDGISTLHLLDTETGKEKPTPEAAAGLGRRARAGTRTARTSGSTWSRRGRRPTSTRSTSSPGRSSAGPRARPAGSTRRSFAEPELVKWKSFDGRTISGFLYRPPAKFTGKRPVVINIHGGPEGQFQPGFLGRNNYFLNELGVALLFPNVRGSSGYGKTFLKLDNGFKREDSYKDIEALLDWMKTRDDLDADRVMVTGGSYGGHMTLAVATYYPERIRCAVDVVGISNFVTFLENTEEYRRDLRRVEYGDERDPKMRAFMEKIAPVNNVHKIKRPMFIVQGKNDPRVPLIEAEQMVAALKGAGVAGLVPDGQGRGPRLRQEGERGLPVLRDGAVHAGAFVEVNRPWRVVASVSAR